MAFKKAQLNRVDILIAHQKGDRQSASMTAKNLGLHYIEPEPEKALSEISNESAEEIENLVLEIQQKTSTSKRPLEGFWYLKKRQRNPKQTLKEEAVKPIEQVIWRNRPTKAPRYTLLASPQDILSRLQQVLLSHQPTKRIDLEKAAQIISRGDVLNKLPRKTKKQDYARLGKIHIIEDRQRHLTPYWKDHKIIKAFIPAYFYQCQFTHTVLLEADHKKNQQKYQKIPAKSTVIILSDLGLLAQTNGDKSGDKNNQRIEAWLQIGRELKQKGCKSFVLLPCEIARCHPKLKQLFKLISWEKTQRKSIDNSKEQTEQLLTALSPAIRIEPSLLRDVRLAMQHYDKKLQIPAAIESLVWQHTDIQEPHSSAATWKAEKRQQRLAAFENLSKEQRETCLAVIRAYRSQLNQQVWFEEIISLHHKSQSLTLIQEDINDAQHYFTALSQSVNKDKKSNQLGKTSSWFKRLEQRLPENSINKSSTLQRISATIHKDDKNFNAKHIDPKNLTESKEEIKQRIIYQQGEEIGIADDVSDIFGSRLAQVDMRSNHLQIQVNGKGESALNIKNQEQQVALPKDNNEFTIISDIETLTFAQLKKPRSLDLGKDKYGIYADLTIKNITQCFRYIEPGTFLMGSPENEIGRNSRREIQHQVTLTQGFWMADTSVTQAFYLAVMGTGIKNPSKFKDNQENPVERVSWNNTQVFIKKLNKQFPKLQASLPTEAQWEYACRAGTSTPFSFGNNITPEQVNYDGGYPYPNGKKGLDRGKTVAVKSLPVNHWGLYEMHGNVWEWCQDVFNEDIGGQPVQDPLENKVEDWRVIRGSSWAQGGMNVRSAVRLRQKSGRRNSDIGFRLLLGHVSSGQEQAEPFVHQHEQMLRDETADHAGEQMVDLEKKSMIDKFKDLFKS